MIIIIKIVNINQGDPICFVILAFGVCVIWGNIAITTLNISKIIDINTHGSELIIL
jgi:hypothetical protein